MWLFGRAEGRGLRCSAGSCDRGAHRRPCGWSVPPLTVSPTSRAASVAAPCIHASGDGRLLQLPHPERRNPNSRWQGEGDVVTATVLPDRPGEVVIESIVGDGGRLSLDAPKNCVGACWQA